MESSQSKPDALSPQQEQAVHLYVDGMPLPDIASRVGCSAATLTSWIAMPEFARQLEAERTATHATTLQRVKELRKLALDILEEMLRQKENDQLRLAAAKELLTSLGPFPTARLGTNLDADSDLWPMLRSALDRASTRPAQSNRKPARRAWLVGAVAGSILCVVAVVAPRLRAPETSPVSSTAHRALDAATREARQVEARVQPQPAAGPEASPAPEIPSNPAHSESGTEPQDQSRAKLAEPPRATMLQNRKELRSSALRHTSSPSRARSAGSEDSRGDGATPRIARAAIERRSRLGISMTESEF